MAMLAKADGVVASDVGFPEHLELKNVPMQIRVICIGINSHQKMFSLYQKVF